MTRLYFVVRGRVQGVGFRWFVAENAESLGLTGWVRNLEDGSVEGEVEGPEHDVNDLIKRLEQGPRSARVDKVESRAAKPQGGAEFEIR